MPVPTNESPTLFFLSHVHADEFLDVMVAVSDCKGLVRYKDYIDLGWNPCHVRRHLTIAVEQELVAVVASEAETSRKPKSQHGLKRKIRYQAIMGYVITDKGRDLQAITSQIRKFDKTN